MDEFDLGSVENVDVEIDDSESDDKETGFDPFADNSGDETLASDQSTTPTVSTSAKKSTNNKVEQAQGELTDKLPVFDYAGATEEITDDSKTFEELRIEKSSDFPELEDGKKVSWTVEYGKITKTVADPKGTSIGKMKADIEKSKEFEDNLKKRGADKNPTCKIKPRVTAQSKGKLPSYKGIFTQLEEAESSGKVISIVPARDGKVYEIRRTEMGRFITPIFDCEALSRIEAGFIPALPPIPAKLLRKIIGFFRHFTIKGEELEALVNVYWDKENDEFSVDIPNQTVTGISVESKIGNYPEERYIHYMDIHSHNKMKAFFSVVDSADEKATRLYAVIGRLDRYIPQMLVRMCSGGRHQLIDANLVFEDFGWEFPAEWLDNVDSCQNHSKTRVLHKNFLSEIPFGHFKFSSLTSEEDEDDYSEGDVL